MALRDGHYLAEDQDVRQGRRFGHLIPVVPAPTKGTAVRCACSRCGAHLMAAAVGGGSLSGSCAVCLSQDFRPVEAVRR